jgi:hypothetical protein
MDGVACCPRVNTLSIQARNVTAKLETSPLGKHTPRVALVALSPIAWPLDRITHVSYSG